MKQYQFAATFMLYKFVKFGKIKGHLLVCLLALSSTAVLVGCTQTTTDSPTTSNSPATSVPANQTPAASNSSATSNTAKTETSPATSASPAAAKMTNAEKIAKAEEALKALYTQQTGVSIESVKCPGKAEFKAGSTFECQATAQGVKFGIQVNMLNDQGRFDSKTKGVLILSRIEELLVKNIKEQAKIDVTADCGGKLRVAKTGETFTCEVKTATGETRKATVTVKDEQGNINVKI